MLPQSKRFLSLNVRILGACAVTAGFAVAQDSVTYKPMAARAKPAAEYVFDEVLVRYRGKPGLDDVRVAATESANGLTRREFNPWLGIHRYGLPRGVDVRSAVRALSADPSVEFAEPNGYRELDSIPNDVVYANYNGVGNDLQKWIFNGIGADHNLDAEPAWSITTGRSDVVIAIIDSGIALAHPDLAANIWTNPGEIAGNGIDDDGNGFIDDVHGADFIQNDGDPNPDLGDGIDNDGSGAADDNTTHGTAVASCASAVGNNALGATGAAWNCRLMALKVFAADFGATDMNVASALTYAANKNASVVNMSFGGSIFSMTESSAIAYAWSHNCVLIASAGNNNSSVIQYPACYPHVLSVGATDSGCVLTGGSGDLDGRASFSQYGPGAVDVVAPGTDIPYDGVGSVADGNPGSFIYALSSGTSFASPIVAGLAALVISRAKDVSAPITNDDVRSIIINTAHDLPDDPGDAPNAGADWDDHGRVDFLGAVLLASNWPAKVDPQTLHTYLLSPLSSDYTTARAQAASVNGYLACITDAVENSWVRSTFPLTGHDWIGLTDELVEGQFRWESGEPLTFTYWCSGEPNNAGNEDYAYINNCAGEGWNDVVHAGSATYPLYALIEVPRPLTGLVAQPLCFGDNSGTHCPCSHVGAAGRGCPNFASASGGLLTASGEPSISTDTLVLAASSAIPFGPGLYFQGSASVVGGSVFGNGLLCLTGSTPRLETRFANAAGSSSTTVAIHVLGSTSAGNVRYYQMWFRDDPSYCPAAGFNLTNAVSITWSP